MWLKLTRFVIVPLLMTALFIAATVAVVVCAITMLFWFAFDDVADYVERQGYSRPNIPDLLW